MEKRGVESKMRIQKLTIGSIVCAKTGDRLTPAMRVVALDERMVYLKIDDEQGDPFEYDITEIVGVPITEEWLIANGFYEASNHPNYSYGKVLSDKEAILAEQIDYYGNAWEVSLIYQDCCVHKAIITHLHQLQALCAITNYKID